MKFEFYDIETLKNVFTIANFRPDNNELELYYLTKDANLFVSEDGEKEWQNKRIVSRAQLEEKARERIYQNNPVFTGTISFYNLRTPEGAIQLITRFGISTDTTRKQNSDSNKYETFVYENQKFKVPRFVRDTDSNFDIEQHPFLVGYNSYQYDTTMLALLYQELFLSPKFGSTEFKLNPNVKTETLRVMNDQLFTSQFKKNMYSRLRFQPKTDRVKTDYEGPNNYLHANLFRKNMLYSGRYIDAARLNEKQTKTKLKRLLGMLGCQILESEKLKPTTAELKNLDELLDLFAYNASDVINLDTLMRHPLYKGSLEVRDGLLKSYPELVYEKKADEYAPNVSPNTVRWDRMYRDSTSAQITALTLFPYSKVVDYPVVSFVYPSQRKCDVYNKKYALEIANGIKKKAVPRNILEETRAFFYEKFKKPEVRAEFDKVYNYYKSLEGKNFNNSESYKEIYGTKYDVHDLSEFGKLQGYLPYYDKNEKPTSYYANFSIGGIHGAEYAKAKFELDVIKTKNYNKWLDRIKTVYPNAVEFREAQTNKLTTVSKTKQGYVEIDGTLIRVANFIKSGKKVDESEYRDPLPVPASPFKINKTGTQELNGSYKYTSVSIVNHEDFKSYYPNMLMQMDLFYNKELGYDRYEEIYNEKERLGGLMSDETIEESLRTLYNIKRDGTKLQLNSVTGGADSDFETNIRANNAILSMRSLGQLFTFRIGASQAYEGAGIPSTNTDGLYTIMDEKINNEILEREAESIGVDIEPELMYFISKDANNRCEMIEKNGQIKVIAAAGSLAAYKGPNPANSLSHAAIIDRVLVDYMVEMGIRRGDSTLTQNFDRSLAKDIFFNAMKEMDRKKQLQMLQNILVSTSTSFNFSSKKTDLSNPQIIQGVNRIFLVKDDSKGVYMARATAKKITPATFNKRARANEIRIQHNRDALNIMKENAFTEFEKDTEASIVNITGLSPKQQVRIDNRDLGVIPEDEIKDLIKHLDIEAYLDLFEDAYTNSWQNDTITLDPNASLLPEHAILTPELQKTYLI